MNSGLYDRAVCVLRLAGSDGSGSTSRRGLPAPQKDKEHGHCYHGNHDHPEAVADIAECHLPDTECDQGQAAQHEERLPPPKYLRIICRPFHHALSIGLAVPPVSTLVGSGHGVMSRAFPYSEMRVWKVAGPERPNAGSRTGEASAKECLALAPALGRRHGPPPKIGTYGLAPARISTRAAAGARTKPWQPTKDAVEQAAAASIGLGPVGPFAAVP